MLPTEGKAWRGIDPGIATMMTFDDGERVENPRAGEGQAEGIKRLQQKLARQEKGSNQRAKTVRKLACKYEKVRNQRGDTLHKGSFKAVLTSRGIALESPHVHGMVRSAKGTRQRPGKNVRQKAGVNRSLHDASIATLLGYIGYKAEMYDIPVVAVDRWFPSSKLCSACGEVHRTLTLKDRVWTCEACGTEHQRDTNAARNILMEGIRLHQQLERQTPSGRGEVHASGGEGQWGDRSPGPVAVPA